MAAPNYNGYSWRDRNARVVVPQRPDAPPGRDAERDRRKRRDGQRDLRRRDAQRRRSFVFVVLIPVVLMLGSVYLHTVASDVGERNAALEDAISEAEARREALEVREAELSDSERIRSIAREDLGMKDPDSTDFGAHGSNTEDGNSGVRQQRQGEVR